MKGLHLFIVSSLACCFGAVASGQAQVQHEVFLANTDHELHVYRVLGEAPGKTLMIIGGIQGDEPGGYMTADLYADIHLKTGNLIVVPRANFYSILLNRRDGQTGDMNRKFTAEEEARRSLEEEVVTVLKRLIAESDCLLNLHEGSGVYSPTWVSDMENPLRFGQSVIFDAQDFVVPETGGAVLHLGEIAGKVVEHVNQQLEDVEYRFKANNHDTLSPDSLHKEQRTSATYYALTVAHIPAFGVETSKMIKTLATKISLQKLVINAMMHELGIEFDEPGVNIPEPELRYLLVKVNGGYPLALPQGAVLEVAEGDDVVVTDIIANYQRGLVADVEGFGTTNDTNRPFRVTDATRVIVRKDSEQCGWVELIPQRKRAGESRVASDKARLSLAELQAEELLIDVNGAMATLPVRQTLTVDKGTRLTLQSIRSNIARCDNTIVVNFKGFAPPKSVNDGNDLLFPIYTDQDLWARYSIDQQGRRYPIVATYNDKVIGEFFVELR